MMEEKVEGHVAQWNSKGFGFVHSNDGRRAYVHNSVCGGEHLVQGETVSVVIAPDDKNPGKLMATSVTRLGGQVETASGTSAPASVAFVNSDSGSMNDFQEGTVQQWNERGYGFLVFPDGRRAYVHNSHCGGEHLQEGETVYAVIAPDEKNPGKFQAVQVQRVPSSGKKSSGSGKRQEARGRKEGVVTQWYERGYGFVEFADGTRAYVHNSQCGGEHLAKGETVTAIVVEDDKNPGKFSAQEVQRFGGKRDTRTTSVPASVAFAPSKPGATAEPVLDYCGRQQGVVQAWNEKGYGFIDFQEGTRAYVHLSACGGEHLVVGETVSAKVISDSKNPGKFAVEDVKRGPAGDDGVVAEWKNDSGYGFLNMDDSRRVYVHRSALGGVHSLIVGQKLRVICSPDARNPGKWCVTEVKGEIAPDPSYSDNGPQAGAVGTDNDASHTGGGEVDGTVKEWRDEGGYGFLAMDDGKWVYIHRSRFGGTGSLVAGQRLRVTIEPDPRNPGKWSVDKVLGELLQEPETSSGGPQNASKERSGGGSGNNFEDMFGPGAYEAALGEGQETSEVQEGTVSDWKEQGGYGFMTMDDGRRVYIHRSAFGGAGSLVIGSRLQVTTKADTKNPGKWSVDKVVGGDVADASGVEHSAKRARTA
eukprot:TRINITY_DN44331_c0_g1_i1.p1 TRINITY_DN44331_c0_g1~~TRINITY_DN44331_c0_g1_i1.p1  ORF type:complete len:644 (+),score=89.35 TRINITY_DN44331_c0_g1_i1:144-2075(+)